MGNVKKMGENRIIEQQRSDKNYRTTKKVRSKFRYVFFHTFRGKHNYRTTGYGKYPYLRTPQLPLYNSGTDHISYVCTHVLISIFCEQWSLTIGKVEMAFKLQHIEEISWKHGLKRKLQAIRCSFYTSIFLTVDSLRFCLSSSHLSNASFCRAVCTWTSGPWLRSRGQSQSARASLACLA